MKTPTAFAYPPIIAGLALALALAVGAAAAGSAIDAATLAAPVRFLSSDSLEGRGPGSRGDRLARLYLATGLEELGLVPGIPARAAGVAGGRAAKAIPGSSGCR